MTTFLGALEGNPRTERLALASGANTVFTAERPYSPVTSIRLFNNAGAARDVTLSLGGVVYWNAAAWADKSEKEFDQVTVLDDSETLEVTTSGVGVTIHVTVVEKVGQQR